MSLRNNGNRRRLNQELFALTEIAKTLSSPLELPDLLQSVMDKIPDVIQAAQIGLVMLWDQPAGLFRPAATFGFEPVLIKALGLRAGESITGKVFDSGAPCLQAKPEDVALAMSNMRPANRVVFAQSIGTDDLPLSTLCSPLSVRENKYGVLILGTMHGQEVFSEEDVPFVQTLADLIALAIDRSNLAAKADAVRQAHQMELMRSEMIAILSHELRLPLTAIQGYSTALLLPDTEWGPSKQREFLQLIDEECHHMQSMLTNILDSSLIDIDQLVIEKEPIRIQRIANDIAVEIQRRAENHKIIVDFPVNLPILEADSRWIKQVFRNILDNAIKYSPEGGLIVMRADCRARDVVVTIADQGIGISPENLIPLFEKFYRVRTPPGMHVPGTGLGLPIARAIIEAHGGRIWVESNIGEGTTIHFSLPLPAYKTDEND